MTPLSATVVVGPKTVTLMWNYLTNVLTLLGLFFDSLVFL